MKHEHYIHELIRQGSFDSYLEIGIGTGKLFDSIPIEAKDYCDPAVNGIDSDTFFANCTVKYDLIFIDGLHHSGQVERDILNAWKHLNSGGMILIHDIAPLNEAMTAVPRGECKEWTGDVYKAWISFVEKYGEKIKTDTLTDVDYGMGVIYKSKHKITSFLNQEITYQDYESSDLYNNN